MKRYIIPLISAAALALSGCGTNEADSSQEDHTAAEHEHMQVGDIAEETKSADVLPSFLSSHPEQVQQIYMIAGQNYELLGSMPCYCGCGESVGHTSNQSCFIREVKESGEIVWDSHATTCVNCLEIALESAAMKQEGKTVLEIRNYIDTKYKEGYAKPTPTPMPSAQ